ncbi:MAG TPA: nucleotidyltransferase family protein [Ktedonobacteraceae bacterium]|nr:nucleotidyltransferase family protein [Ktedonobacteraceae bacterium]
MEEQTYSKELIQLIRSTHWFMSVLETVRTCNPPDWLVGAGVIRNLVWDHLHRYQTPTPLADIDVIFFDPQDVRPERDHMVQQQLAQRLPHVTWEATNQAAVHLWYEDVFGFSVPSLHSSEEAVGTWPETATSVAVRLLPTDEIHIVAPCGLSDLFNMVLRRNPCRVTHEQFIQRLHAKQILRKWPHVQVIYDEPVSL